MKILFITCSRIGDAVLTTGILSEIQKRYPFAKVTIAVDPLPASLFEDYPLLNDLIVFPKQRLSKHWLTLWTKVVGQKWDWVIDLRGSAISYLLLTKKRVVWKSKPSDPRHKVEQVSALIDGKAFSPELWFSEKWFEKTRACFDNHPCVAVAPAANWVGKQWPISSFIEVFKRFSHQYPETKIAIFAAPHEKSMVEPLIESLPKEQVLSFFDKNLSLIETAACIKQCKVFIGNDSGLMHIAAALRVPTIGLFGPSREQNYRPWQDYDETRNIVVRIPMTYDELKSTPEFSHKSQDCYMTSLSVETVWPILENHWERYKG
ncbi:MAG: glycosyltransferase family 9 protein [Alphaproteobacteria bacterium]|nr:glycosyltransferase family 9 protein [Alphaproteobacteria bacterium]